MPSTHAIYIYLRECARTRRSTRRASRTASSRSGWRGGRADPTSTSRSATTLRSTGERPLTLTLAHSLSHSPSLTHTHTRRPGSQSAEAKVIGEADSCFASVVDGVAAVDAMRGVHGSGAFGGLPRPIEILAIQLVPSAG